MLSPPIHPDIRRQLKARLFDLSPRAFELFAGDLLTYIGLQHVTVTRYVGDGGVDAQGDLISESQLICVPTGVQVKRYRNNVQRADIDRFLGAIGGTYRHGIFITTAGYAEQARIKAQTSPIVRVDTVSGDDVVTLMTRHQLGMASGGSPGIDEGYFLSFEAQAAQRPMVAEAKLPYTTGMEALAEAPEDIISLRALSYALRVDPYTVRNWIERGRLQPDATAREREREHYFFRRDRIDQIHHTFVRGTRPTTGEAWRQAFLDFARSRTLTKSYKPVLLLALLQLVDRNGEVYIDDLVAAFQAFYIQRWRDGLVIEFDVPLLRDPLQASASAIKQLIIKHPLERFRIQGFLEYDAATGMVRFAPQLWIELRAYELRDVYQSAQEQIAYYYQQRQR